MGKPATWQELLWGSGSFSRASRAGRCRRIFSTLETDPVSHRMNTCSRASCSSLRGVLHELVMVLEREGVGNIGE
jgi:hypothetical protein